MTRKDYGLIAFAISNIDKWYPRKIAAEALSDTFAKDNPNFKPRVFLEACDATVRKEREIICQ